MSRGLAKPSATISFGGEYAEGFLLAMDKNYPTILTMAGVTDVATLQKMYDDAAGVTLADPIPALASQELIDLNVHDDSSVYVGRVYVPVDITGTPDVTPEGGRRGPVPDHARGAAVRHPVRRPGVDERRLRERTWGRRGGGRAAWHRPDLRDHARGVARGHADSALIGGVERAIAIAVIAVGLLAAVALLVTILRGVRERGRALSMLRTQGMGFRYGWWLALAELAPLTLAARDRRRDRRSRDHVAAERHARPQAALRRAQRSPAHRQLDVLRDPGGRHPDVLLFLAVAVEVLAHRRNKLSEVLRWGESR